MKLYCDKSELIKSINISMKAISSKTSLPILKCLLLVAKDNKITLTSNDTELGIETNLNGNVEEEGQIAIDAKLFYDIIRSMPDGDVNITTDENFIAKIVCGKSKFQLSCFDGNDFVLLPEFEKTNKITISQLLLKNSINQTIFSVPLNEKNKIMTGELFKIEENKLTIRSLDGHRISQRIVECETSGSFLDNIIIPGKSLIELSRIMEDDANSNINIYCAEKYVLFEFNETRILTRLIDGEYFNVDAMLKSDSEIKVNINRRDLSDSIERSLLMLRETEKKPVVLQIFDKSMILSIQTTIGLMDEEIDIEKQGNDLTVGINPKFLIDVLKSIEEERVDLYFNGAKSPCIIKNEEETYIYLFMPINMN